MGPLFERAEVEATDDRRPTAALDLEEVGRLLEVASAKAFETDSVCGRDRTVDLRSTPPVRPCSGVHHLGAAHIHPTAPAPSERLEHAMKSSASATRSWIKVSWLE